ncbi:MAG: hypothetical protein WD768_12790 [Phycisphaeraceae bacterium]
MKHHSHQSSARRGMTVVELLLGIAGTGIVASAIAAMLSAVSYGTGDRNDMRSQLVRQASVTNRLTAAVRSSLKILARGDDYIVFWMHDDRADEKPNISELRLIEVNASSKTLTSYEADFSGMTEDQKTAADTAYELSDNFASITTTLKSSPTFPGTLWAKGVNQVDFELNASDVQEATLVAFTISWGSGSTAHTAVGTAALRSQV